MANFLEAAAFDVLVTQYVSVASVGLLLYDHVITFQDEVALIWPAKFGVVKAIFLFNRYVVSLWIVMSLCSDIFIATSNVLSHYQSFTYYQIFNICFGTIQHSWTFWLNGILYHASILVILIYVWLSTPRKSQTPLMQVVVRDGLWYFVTIFCAMLFNLLVWRFGPPTLIGLPYTSVWCMTLTSLSRMLLSMGSVQSPEEWGQRAKIVVPVRDIELGGLSPELNRAASFKRM
ncbi:hypothetical protein FRC06_009224 [Ceratobasidium sp. 370]|nr:hypothetical protein FRC06_009224 [Ceratobasidium sp. 370]